MGADGEAGRKERVGERAGDVPSASRTAGQAGPDVRTGILV